MTQVSEGKESTKGQSTRPARGGLCWLSDASPTAQYLEAQLPHLKRGTFPSLAYVPDLGSVSGEESRKGFIVWDAEFRFLILFTKISVTDDWEKIP